MVERPVAGTQTGRLGQRAGDEVERVVHRFEERTPAGQARRDRGRERAARAVRARGFEPGPAPARELTAVEEDVDHLAAREMAALDQRGPRARATSVSAA